MKKKIFFGILFSAILAINVISVSKTDVSDLSLISLMQTAQAQTEGGECYPWSPNYNIVTGQCDLAPSGERGEPGLECYWLSYNQTTNDFELTPRGYTEISCVWAVVGTCTPINC